MKRFAWIMTFTIMCSFCPLHGEEGGAKSDIGIFNELQAENDRVKSGLKHITDELNTYLQSLHQENEADAIMARSELLSTDSMADFRRKIESCAAFIEKNTGIAFPREKINAALDGILKRAVNLSDSIRSKRN